MQRWIPVAGLAAVLWGALWAPALAATGGGPPPETMMLAQVVILVVGGRILGELMHRLGQPSILGQIIVGILLGPTVFGSIWPAAEKFLFPTSGPQSDMVTGVAQLGILFLLLLAGMETDLGLAYRLRRQAAGVSLAGIAVPFACGFALGMLVPDAVLPDPGKRLVTALFLGTALSISSLKIVATVVREMNFMRRDVGQLIVGSAVIDDTVGWVIIAITLGIATRGSLDLPSLALTVLGTGAFLYVCLTVGRRAAFELIRWTNDTLHSEVPVTSAIIALMGVLALITAGLGVQTVLGAFVAGLLIGESPILTRQIDEQLRGLTTALFMPVFFGLTGLHTDLRVLGDPATLGLAAGLVLIASIGKFGGAFIGAMLNGMSRKEALALGFGMNARGSTEVIVASIGLSVGVLDQRLFSVIVTMAVVTTLIMPPTLRWALSQLPLSAAEKERLQRDEFEEHSIVGQLERMLLVVDDSASGRLASRLAGQLGGLRNMPVTALNLAPEPAAAKPAEAPVIAQPADGATIKDVKESAAPGVAEAQQKDETRTDPLSVGTRLGPQELAERLRAEAGRGHDLLVTGSEPLVDPKGGFAPRADTLVTAFGRTTAIVSARGSLRRRPEARLKILIPVSDDVRSVRSVEFASLLARANGVSVTVLHVRNGADAGGEAAAGALLERVKKIGEQLETQVRTILARGRSPGLSIADEAKRGRYNLIILGVGRRTSDALSFGPVPDTLLETSNTSLVFFVTS